MDALSMFLREHASAHSPAVGKAPVHLDWMLAGLDDAQWRRRPHGLHSIAWLFWHVTQVEDACVAPAVFGVAPLLDADRASRLGVASGRRYTAREDDDVLAAAVRLDALRAYRDDVGRRTQELARELWPDRWTTPITAADVRRAADAGGLDGDETYLVGQPRESLLCWWGLTHVSYHIGQMAMVRSAFASGRTR